MQPTFEMSLHCTKDHSIGATETEIKETQNENIHMFIGALVCEVYPKQKYIQSHTCIQKIMCYAQ